MTRRTRRTLKPILILDDGREVNEEHIRYADADALRSLLLGQKILSITETTGKAIHKAEYKLEVAAWREAGAVGEKPYRSSYWGGRDEYDRVLQFHLDGGYTLRAHAHDGGCACSNGCFSVDIEAELRERLTGATILGLQVEERQTETSWDDDYANRTETERVFIDGQPAEDGETVNTSDYSTIVLFVYTDLITEKQPLVTSSGGDNGYYGWGFHFSVDRTIVVEESATTDDGEAFRAALVEELGPREVTE